ncbi:MAG: GNAT family N-acetyltransferase [Anaerolineae bacterium]|jgi:ribosomal protein S18 acetylase RimI-like enzyme|nr:GNAT family N-acetyltransferase [Anaerolineae bacterium]MDH7475392.1 GNAT family N-acetyltransferase [Anaerolineae bacterium]
MRIRTLVPADLERLSEINSTFISESILVVERTGEGLEVGWRLAECPLAEPFAKGRAYDLSEEDLARSRRLYEAGPQEALQLIAEDRARLVGLLEVERWYWNNSGWLWNVIIDRDYRRQGLGRQFVHRAIAWGRQLGLRALILETQTNNINACRFYQTMGFRLCGINDHYYTNDDLNKGEVAIFWALELM